MKAILDDDILISLSFVFSDDNYHSLDSKNRFAGDYRRNPIFIGSNVFISTNVTILQDVTIGNNSVLSVGVIIHSDMLKGPKQSDLMGSTNIIMWLCILMVRSALINAKQFSKY
ncbi:hypothetical protein ACXRSW_09685 [Aeromonas dhakensis]|uniref:hypothetical protein n=1 Tax=Aeromonas TaxID=642 RepID=UPI00094C3F95|nr:MULTISPECIES: hypothetical protein [Aeromonas]EGX6956509.1 hypothetical protein [Aeromonas hydrophila]MBW3843905.1 hypothetical protein [Aeromonas hydrophila]MCA4699016.1 hypothetical protein [Aeromonas hydrophila]MCX4114724.1 hypothetical protein [Aeromonas hydrophila]MDD9305546.1 hypothetical protein [Aeromonas hydrophila]